MSAHTANRALTVPAIRARKGGEPIVCLTAYTAATAALIDPHVDLILVGDSLGMVIYGLPNTLSVTLDMMIAHGRAVARGGRRALVVVDMPFGSYEEGPAVAFRHAARLLAETGAQAVKLEGGVAMAETVAFLTSRGIPVMGHIGLMPQQVHARGGFIAQGTSRADWQAIEADAQAIAAAGAFSVVVEAVSEPLAAAITSRLPVPTIGIGASAACDGQILVLDDMLGLTGRTPRFVKRYAELGQTIGAAVADYAAEVRGRQFPAAGHLYGVKD